MSTGKSLLILGIVIAGSTLLLGVIFAYLRTQSRQPPGLQNYNQGVERLMRGDYRGAIEAFTQALRLNPNLVEAYTCRGNARFELGDKQGAVEDYDHTLRLNPNDANAYYYRGNACSDLEDKQEAIEDYQRAAKLFFEQKDTANYRRASDSLKKLRAARTRSTSAVKTENKPQSSQTQPTNVSDTVQKAEEFLNQGFYKAKEENYKGAIADFNQALEINPNDAQAYHNRGIARFKLGETQGSIEDFTQALRLNPDYAEAYVGRGNAYCKLRDNQGAIIDYTQILRLSPNDAKTYYNRGVAYSKVGDKQRAIEDYQKALKLFYEQGDEVNCRRALDNLKQLQMETTPPKSSVNTEKPFNPSSTPPRSSSKPSSASKDSTIRLDQASRELENKLLRLLHGDRSLAIRLLSEIKTQNPGKSVDWYVEKVIYDLERDRGR